MNEPRNADVRGRDIVLSLLLTIGIAASYIPQHLKLVRAKSSHGLSIAFLVLSVLSSFANLCNVFILQLPYIARCPSVVQVYGSYAVVAGSVRC